MKKLLLPFLIALLLISPLRVGATPVSWDAVGTVLQPLTALRAFEVKGAFFTATDTAATSTFPRAKITTSVSFLGDYVTNSSSWIRGKLSAGTGIGYDNSTGVITNNGVTSIVAGTNITLTGGVGTGAVTINSTASGGGSGTVATSTQETKGQIPFWTSTNGFPATLGSVATGTVSGSGAITATAGQSIIGSGLTIACTNASAGVTGCLTGTDWSLFNGKQTAITTSFPLSLSGGTLSFGGLSTTTALSSGQVDFSTGVNTIGNDSGFIWDNTNKRLGLGTSTPWAQLSVNPDGITGPAFAIGSSTKTLFQVSNGGNLTAANGFFTVSGADGALVTTGGGSATFGGPIRAANAAGGSIVAGATSGTVPSLIPNRSSTAAGIGADAAGNLSLITGSATQLEILSGGNVGVGSTTPYAKLAVSGFTTGTPGLVVDGLSGFTGNLVDIKLASSTLFFFRQDGVLSATGEVRSGSSALTTAGIRLGNLAGTLQLGGVQGSGATANSAGAEIDLNNISQASQPGVIQFRTGTVSTNNQSEVARIDASGNFGIATTSPYAKLAVGGDVVIGASTAGGTLGNLYLPTLGTPAGTFVAADATGKLIATTSPSGASPAGSGSELQFRTNGTTFGAVTNSAFLSSAAKLGIGTTTPWASFEVASGSPQIALTNPNAGLNQKHWFEWVDNTGGLNFGTTSDTLATSTPALTLTNIGHLALGAYSGLVDSWRFQTIASTTEAIFSFGQATTTTYTVTQTYATCGTYTWVKPAGFVSASTTVVGAGGGGAADDAVTTEDSGYGGGSSMALSGLLAATAGGGASASVGHPASGGGGAMVASTSILSNQLTSASYTVTVGCGGKGGNTLNPKTGIGYFNGGTGTTGSSGSSSGKAGTSSSGGNGGGNGGGGGAGTTGNGGNGTSGSAGTGGTGGSIGAGTTVDGSNGGVDSTAGGKSGYGLSQGGTSFATQGTTGGDGIYGAGGGGAGNSNFAGTSRAGNGGDGIVIITSTVTVLPALNSGPSGMVQIGTYLEDAMLTINTYLGRAARSVLQTISSTQYRTEYLDQYAHYYTGGPAPTLSSCGTASVAGDDRTGVVTKTSGTTCTLTFANAYSNGTTTSTVCVAAPYAAANVAYTQTSSSLALTFSAAQTGFGYICQAHGAYPLPQ